MSTSGENLSPAHRCPRCNSELPTGVPPELCPKCLLKAGMEAGPGGTVVAPKSDARSHGLPQPGEQLGNYIIIRLLGKGGMGAVFEAEDLESGRRLALKVLSHALDSPEARERFFREGRLAASINHPNSVYIFGTGEIGGTPYIAMELVAGGTLQDRVRVKGPLHPSEAVDAVLQLIAGLDAAQRIGILHRDVKPSNCFMDSEGTVKIGDFGLSISTAIRTEPALTAAGQFLGTPAFCSPEQLRGEELNARSDMYSVGVTLYFLLTGRTPFDAQNMVQLLANVLEKQAPSPRLFQRTIPQGLAKAVLRCLEKQPSNRFKSYKELQEALEPYSSTAATPATLGLRFLAGVLDMVLLSLFSGTASFVIFGNPMERLNRMSKLSPEMLLWMLLGTSFFVLYYAIGEGVWGATVGKFICRLRVVLPDGSPPGLPRGLARGLIYVLLPAAPFWLFSGGDMQAYLHGSGLLQFSMQSSYYVVLAVLFSTMRRRNGFAAIHDLVTRTRVIFRSTVSARTPLSVGEDAPVAPETQQRFGPYHVLERLGQRDGVEWALGYDLRLLRKVWLRIVPPGTPALPAAWRNIGRPGRLRWLAGRRMPEENWDAFEGVTGQPLVKLTQTRQLWKDVRYWLYDLASEMSAAEKDGTLPPVLALDRVWITGDGRAKLLDFAVPGVEEHRQQPATVEMPGKTPVSANQFLAQVATCALVGESAARQQDSNKVKVPLPLHARAFVENLPKLPDADAVKSALKPLLSRLAVVSRGRRAAVVAVCAAVPLLTAIFFIFAASMMHHLNQQNPGLMELSQLLNVRSSMGHFGQSVRVPDDKSFAIFIANHYRPLITNSTAWNSPMVLAMIKGDSRRFAEQSVAAYPAPTEKEIAEAEAAVKPVAQSTEFFDYSKRPGFVALVASVGLIFYVGLPAILAAILFRGGLILLAANMTFVRRDGKRASRLRVLVRALAAWSPIGLTILVCIPIAFAHPILGQVIAYSIVGGLAVVSIALPGRSLPDRLAGTWPVPR